MRAPITLISRFLNRHGYLYWLRTPETEADIRRVEHRLSYARAFVAGACLLVMGLDPKEPPVHKGPASLVLLGYLAYSLLLIFWLRGRRPGGPSRRLEQHAADVLWVSYFIALTQGPNDPSWVLFFFALTSAAVRWEHWETLATALVCSVLTSFGAVYPELLPALNLRSVPGPDFFTHTGYLLIAGFLTGVLFEAAKRLSAERALVERLLGFIERDADFASTMQRVCKEVARVFDCRTMLVAVREGSNGPAFLLQISRGDGEPSFCELDSASMDVYFFSVEGRRHFIDSSPRLPRTGSSGAGAELPERFRALYPFHSLVAIANDLGKDWAVRVFLLDAAPAMCGAAGKKLARTIAQRLGNPLYGLFLLWQLNARVGEKERARVACELHDGAIQSMIGLELRMETVRRNMGSGHPHVDRQLNSLQSELRRQITELREFTQLLSPVHVDSAHLPDYLRDIAARFQSATGIQTRFAARIENLDLPKTVPRELIRILQEALINIRKHSGAGSVEVTLEERAGLCALGISDDGCGLDFTGCLSLKELEARGKGPAVIRERVRLIGGDLSIESAPGRGTRIAITIPQSSYEKTASNHPDPAGRKPDHLPGRAAPSAAAGARFRDRWGSHRQRRDHQARG